jgi:hypothetical protein
MNIQQKSKSFQNISNGTRKSYSMKKQALKNLITLSLSMCPESNVFNFNLTEG